MKEVQRLFARTVGQCTICNKTGYIRSGVNVTSCSCRNRFYELKRFSEIGLPPDYWDKTFGTYQNPDPKSFDTVVRYTVDLDRMFVSGSGLYVWGTFGVGKSGLAVEVLKEVLRRKDSTGNFKWDAAFMFWPEVMRKLTAFDEVPAEERAALQEQMKSVDFLCIDDVGREYRAQGSNWVASNIDAIFRCRMMTGTPTILTSNFSMNEVEKFYGTSLFSVFRGSLIEVAVEGGDYRAVVGDERRKELLEG